MKTCKAMSTSIDLHLPQSDYVVIKFNYTEATLEGSDKGAGTSSFGDQTGDSVQTSSMEDVSESEPDLAMPLRGYSGIKTPHLMKLLKHLRKQPKWNNDIAAHNLRLELQEVHVKPEAFEGDHVKSYFELTLPYYENLTSLSGGHVLEAVYAWTQAQKLAGEGAYEEVLYVNIDDSPALQYCLAMETIAPAVDDLDTWQTLLSKSFRKETLTNLYSGFECSVVIGKQIDTRWMSQGYKDALVTEIDSEAKSASEYYDKMSAFLGKALYDEDYFYSEGFMNMYMYPTVEIISNLWTELMDVFWKTTTSNLMESVPDLSIGYTRKSKRIGEQLWSISHTFGGVPVEENTVELDYEWAEHTSLVSWSSEYSVVEYCVVSADRIHTFDGLRLNASLTACPTLLSSACEAQQHHVFGVSAWADPQRGLRALVAAEWAQMTVQVSSQGVQVNREKVDPAAPYREFWYNHPWKYPYRRVGARVHQRGGSIKVEIDEIGHFIMKEGHLYIHIDAARYGGYVCGLCGNRDLDPTNDMAGPQHCALSDAPQLVRAWSPEHSPQCPAPASAPCQKNSDWDPQSYSCHHLTVPKDDMEPFQGKCG